MTSKPTARERFEVIKKSNDAVIFRDAQISFLLSLVEAAIVFGATIGLRGMSPNAPMTEKQALEGLGTEIWEKINQRLAQVEGKK